MPVALLPALTLAVGILATLLVWRLVLGQERGRLEQALERRASAAAVAVDAEIQRYQDLALATAGLIGGNPDLTRAEFDRYIDTFDLTNHYAGSSGVGVVVPADAAGLEALLARLAAGEQRLDGGGGTAGADEHFISTAQRLSDGTPPSLGTDLAQAPEAAEALRRARDVGVAALSRTYVLLRDRELPPENQQRSFIVAAPVYEGVVTPATVAARRERLHAWVTVAFRGGDFLGDVLRDEGRWLDVQLVDGDGEVVAVLRDRVAQARPAALPDSRWRQDVRIRVDSQTWTLTALPRAEFFAEADTANGELALIVGLVGSILLAALVAAPANGRRRALELVERTTASLQRATAELEQSNLELRARNHEMRALALFQRDFVASASHELRTPLTSIMGYLELVLDFGESLTPDQRANLETVRRGAERLLALVGDLLTVNQVESGNLPITRSPVRVRDLLDDLREQFAGICAAGELTLHVEAADHLPPLWVDRARIEQVVGNLLGNAVTFTPAGGTVALTAQPHGAMVRITVSDTGIGIPEDDLLRVFERFFRSSSAINQAAPGTGLGLSIVKAIVEAHGGSIAVSSRVGEGSTFTVDLPTVEKEQAWPASSSSTTIRTSSV